MRGSAATLVATCEAYGRLTVTPQFVCPKILAQNLRGTQFHCLWVFPGSARRVRQAVSVGKSRQQRVHDFLFSKLLSETSVSKDDVVRLTQLGIGLEVTWLTYSFKFLQSLKSVEFVVDRS